MEIGSLSLILIVGLLILISIGVPMGFASGFMGAVLVFLYIGEHALGILLSRYYSLVVTYSFLSVPLFIFIPPNFIANLIPNFIKQLLLLPKLV